MYPAAFSFFFNTIKTKVDYDAAVTATWVFDIILAIVFVLIMILVANLIKYQPGRNDRSGVKRRVWYFVIGFIGLLSSLGLDIVLYLTKITVPTFQNKYMAVMAVASVVACLVYFLLGFVIIKISRKGTKLESIFPKKD